MLGVVMIRRSQYLPEEEVLSCAGFVARVYRKIRSDRARCSWLQAGLSLLVIPSVFAQPGQAVDDELLDDGTMLSQLLMDGGKLSDPDVTSMESTLCDSKPDYRVRVMLVGHYSNCRLASEHRDQLAKQLCFFIEHAPSSGVFYYPEFEFVDFSRNGREKYKRARELWQAAIDKDPGNNKILRNAARFSRSMDPPYAMNMLERVCEFDPKSRDACIELASLCELYATRSTDSRKHELLTRAKNAYQQGLRAYPTRSDFADIF